MEHSAATDQRGRPPLLPYLDTEGASGLAVHHDVSASDLLLDAVLHASTWSGGGSCWWLQQLVDLAGLSGRSGSEMSVDSFRSSGGLQDAGV